MLQAGGQNTRKLGACEGGSSFLMGEKDPFIEGLVTAKNPEDPDRKNTTAKRAVRRKYKRTWAFGLFGD